MSRETPEAQSYTAAVTNFGSYEHYLDFKALCAADSEAKRQYLALFEGAETEDELIELMTIAPPYFIDAIQLRALPLYLLGVPDGSTVHDRIRDRSDLRARRKLVARGHTDGKPIWKDFTKLGWPMTMGNPRRIGSPEEIAEIERRLKTTTLTMPGSEVSIRGQSLASLFEENVPEPKWLIDGLLREGGALMVYGESGIGKSWLTTTLMLMASHGQSVGIQDHETGAWVLRAGEHNSRKVALIDGEMIKADILSRCKVLCGALGLTPASSAVPAVPIDPAQLRLAMTTKVSRPNDVSAESEGRSDKDTDEVLLADVDAWIEALGGGTGPESASGVSLPGMSDKNTIDLSKIELRLKTDQDAKAVFPDLADPDWKTRIIEFALSEGMDIIVFDNLSTLCPSLEDENAATAWAPFNDLIVSLKHIGVASIVVHHSGKGGNYRGSSNIVTALENSVKLSKVDSGDEVCRDARFKVEVEKNRGHEQPAINGKVLRLTDGKWQVELDEQGTTERILRMVRSCRYTKQTEVSEAAAMGQSTVSKLLKQAYILGLATKQEVADCWEKAKQLRMSESVFDEDLDGAVVTLDI